MTGGTRREEMHDGRRRRVHRLLLTAALFPAVAGAQDSVYAPLAAQVARRVRAMVALPRQGLCSLAAGQPQLVSLGTARS